MTLGQRIAQKRKELGLSQESLGERLGVSRQAIYKWESDSSLPEIEKLIALSKIFSVPVGWLLGVEEEASAPSGGKLTEEQLAMVQEIVDRYLAAQKEWAPPAPKRRRWPFLLAALALALVFANLFSRLEQVTQNYSSLQHAINNVSYDVNSQISSITNRVEDILKSQNSLTAEWSTELAATDLAANTAAFDLRAVPKTYVEGMTALFVAESGGERVELPVEPGADHAFAGQITCPLTDGISLSVVFVTGDKRETQWLEDYDYLYSNSFPELSLSTWAMSSSIKGDVLPAQWEQIDLEYWGDTAVPWVSALEQIPNAKAFQVGLFRDQKLVCWYQEGTDTIMVNGQPQPRLYWAQTGDVTLEVGRVYQVAGVLTDVYGRQRVYPDSPYLHGEEAGPFQEAYQLDSDPANWEF